MTFLATQELQKFRDKYPEQPPQVHCEPLTLVKLNQCHGVTLLQPSPASDVKLGMPPSTMDGSSTNRYLWVIDRQGVPYIIERALSDIDGMPKHTNLTGGETAYLGGELWFKSNSSLFLSGGSGRYPPANADQLIDAVRVFESYGYCVNSLGWDFQNDRAWRRVR